MEEDIKYWRFPTGRFAIALSFPGFYEVSLTQSVSSQCRPRDQTLWLDPIFSWDMGDRERSLNGKIDQ